MTIKVEVVNNKKYFTAIYKGTEYTLYELCGDWFLSTRRLALGKSNIGGGKYFDTLKAVSEGCKAFGDVETLTKTVYGF
jgi:hypothetical protein